MRDALGGGGRGLHSTVGMMPQSGLKVVRHK